jgi:trk system potassium uptake protein TrkH
MIHQKLQRFIRQRLSPAQQIAFSFAGVILLGAFLLAMPISNQAAPIPFLDHVFMSISAVCVTGLVVVVPAAQYSTFGQVVLMLLIQVGGLGLMTLLAIFVLFVSGKLSLSNRLAMSEATNQFDLRDFNHFLIAILKYTLFFEVLGFMGLSLVFVPELGLGRGLFVALFTTISAFSNAGLDIVGSSSLQAYLHHPLINLIVPSLIIMGGLGFGVWFDVSQGAKRLMRHEKRARYIAQHLKIHSKLAIVTSAILIVLGFVIIYLFEFNNPNQPITLMAAFFQSVTTRTAGFSTIDVHLMRPSTLVVMMVLMFIGGSPGGTAGGIKTTTFALMGLMIVSELRGSSELTIFNRQIPRTMFRKAFVVAFSLIALSVLGVIILSKTESFDFLEILFEVVSAVGTVGLSLGITDELSQAGRLVIMALMYMGRIGPLTLMLSVSNRSIHKAKELKYPTGDILIG